MTKSIARIGTSSTIISQRPLGYLRSREIEKNGTGWGKKNGAKAKVRAWEVRAIRIAKLDRAVQEDPSNNNPAENPAF